MIHTTALSKLYNPGRRNQVVALDAVDLRVEPGEIYALLGPNGAGKTTALRILSTLIAPSSGDAFVGGVSVRADPAAVRTRIGVVSYETGVYERLTPREIGRFFGRLNGLDDWAIDRAIDEIVERLDMAAFIDRRCEELSTGMRQKTVLLRALVTRPQVLLFDEPTAGLDVLAARGMLNHLSQLRADGKTILFSTHVMVEAERLADRIGIIDRGRLRIEGTLEELRQRTGLQDLDAIFFHLLDPATVADTAA